MRNIRVGTKLHIITAVATLVILGVAALLLLTGRTAMMDEKKIATRAIVDSAHSIVAYYHQQGAAGALSDADAQKGALAALRSIRFGSGDYVWVNDMQPMVVMHPIKPELDGKDASGIKDPKGNALFVRFVEVVKAQGSGFVQYLWPKPGQQEPVEKISYVKGFAPWGWVIGSGIYIDDVQAAFSAGLVRAVVIVGAAALLFALMAAALERGITRRLRLAVDLIGKVSKGDLTTEIEITSKDEIGMVLQALKEMNESLTKVVRKVRLGTDTIASACGEIAAGNLDLSQRTEEQAASLEETAASMEELTSTVKQNADNADTANQLARSASDVATKGGEVVTHVVHTMASINQSSRKVAEIISLIDGIAFQTNILALNAAVEAARAGEQGRGFAVVAAEVRSLAQRSASAAKEIKTLIDDSVGKVDAGSKLVAEAGKTMDQVVGSIKSVTDIMEEITAASREQTSGIEQVDQAVTQMDKVTQQNAALVEEAAAAAQALREQADELVEAVAVFKLGSDVQAARAIKKAQAPGKVTAAHAAGQLLEHVQQTTALYPLEHTHR
jgi:methyl-accepting chemotaxis protein